MNKNGGLRILTEMLKTATNQTTKNKNQKKKKRKKRKYNTYHMLLFQIWIDGR